MKAVEVIEYCTACLQKYTSRLSVCHTHIRDESGSPTILVFSRRRKLSIKYKFMRSLMHVQGLSVLFRVRKSCLVGSIVYIYNARIGQFCGFYM